MEFEEPPQHFYIKHHSDDIVYKFNMKCAKISNYINNICELDPTVIENDSMPIVVTQGNKNSFLFILRYLDFYINEEEAREPEKPLQLDTSIEDIFKYEWILFKDIIELEISDNKLALLCDLTKLANFMDMKKLLNKLCAITAYTLKCFAKKTTS
jgi:hypothetical protein